MNHVIGYTFVGYCNDIDFYENLDSGEILISEDLRDALPYLYEKHFGVPYRELGWWLEPGAKEWVKEIEDMWLHNKLDLSDLYKDEDFLNSLVEKYSDQINEDTINDLQDEFEDLLRDELDYLDNDELKELYEYDDSVNYTIEDGHGNIVASGFVSLPELDEDEEED